MLIGIILFIASTIVAAVLAIKSKGELIKALSTIDILKSVNAQLERNTEIDKMEIKDLKVKLSAAKSEIELLRAAPVILNREVLNGLSTTEPEVEVGAEMEELLDKLMDQASEPMKEKMPYFEFFTDGDDNFRWRFKGKNNKIVADSGEGYKAKQNMRKGIGMMLEAIKTGKYGKKWNA